MALKTVGPVGQDPWKLVFLVSTGPVASEFSNGQAEQDPDLPCSASNVLAKSSLTFV